VDYLLGLKENVIVGHLIPAGTGLKKFQNILVTPKEPYKIQEPTTPEVEEELIVEEVEVVKKETKKRVKKSSKSK
jgi:DNA-directed RNA polymerase subunit beta'